MDFMKKTTGLPSFFLISTLLLSWSAGNFVLSNLYFLLQENPETDRFFRGYQRAGKTIGYAVLFFGNVGLYFLPEKSVACLLTFLSLALYCLCTLFCIQPYTDFGALDFLLSATLNQTLSVFKLRSLYTWLVIIVCIVIAGIRYRLEPVHSPGEATSHEDLLESGLLPSMTYEAVSPLPLVARLDDNPTPSDNFLELAPSGLTCPLIQGDFIGQLPHMTRNKDPLPLRALLLEANPEILFKNVDSFSQLLSQLRKLTIRGCEMLPRIVAKENWMGESTGDEVMFHQLQRLVLLDLPNLGDKLVLQDLPKDLPNLVSLFRNVKSWFPNVNTALPKFKIN